MSTAGPSEEYSVGRVAELAGVTVRTLHHYDEIGLLRPHGRSPAGYRRYSAADVERLQQVLIYRRLGFGLEEIAPLLDDPAVDALGHLRRQRELLVRKGAELAEMVRRIDEQLAARNQGMQLTPEEQLEIFGTDKVGGEWADEAERRWGETDLYQESQRRTAAYTKDDWTRLKDESDAGLSGFADAMRSGEPADGDRARALAEEHRHFLNKWFYECPYSLHRNLALMYVEDERFRTTFEAVFPGLADYMSEAIIANADRQSLSE